VEKKALQLRTPEVETKKKFIIKEEQKEILIKFL
jgi:hypothetical protein